MDQKRIEDTISDYHWMVREISRLQSILYSSPKTRNWGVAQYGIDAAMPKGSSIRSKKELEAMDRREMKLYSRLKRFEKLVEAIEIDGDLLVEDIHQVVYDCIADGMSYRAISRHIGMSREKVRQIKDEILNHLCQNCHSSHIWHVLTSEKYAS